MDKENLQSGFAAGTKVHTDQGIKRIEEIQVGDMMLSKSKRGGEISYQPVINIFRSIEKLKIFLL